MKRDRTPDYEASNRDEAARILATPALYGMGMTLWVRLYLFGHGGHHATAVATVGVVSQGGKPVGSNWAEPVQGSPMGSRTRGVLRRSAVWPRAGRRR
jgi:hypothetical protein